MAREGAAAIRVALADDSYLMRAALQHVLERTAAVELVAVCEHGDELLEAVEREAPDVVVADLRMPPSGDEEGIRIARLLRRRHPGIGVVVLSHFAEPRYGVGLVEDGAEGRAYLLKERVRAPEDLLAAIEAVARGVSMIDPEIVRMLLDATHGSSLAQLTPRERDVLAHMAQGKSNAAIADALVLTKRAVEKHVGQIFSKLDLLDEDRVSRRVAAVLLFLSQRETDGRR